MGWRKDNGPTASSLVKQAKCQIGMISIFSYILRSPAQDSAS